MKRPIITALATAMLIALAMAVPATAQPPSDETADTADMADMADVMPSEDEAEGQMATDESEVFAGSPSEDAPQDDLPDATIAEEDGTAAPEGKTSESRQLKSKLKRMLIGLLLPAVERRMREAADSDDGQSGPEAEPELEPESES